MEPHDNGQELVGAEIHRKAMQSLADEMAVTLVRTSGSPVVTEARDFATGVMSRAPVHLGFSSQVLIHVGSSLVGCRAVSEAATDVRPGDGWLVNDPHSAGAMHQGDLSVIMPTFHRDALLGWSFASVHVLDVGGVGISGFAPGARDVWQEGMLFPPIRVIEGGAIDAEWERYIAANVRAPGAVLNDIRAMVAANNTASRRLAEIVDEYGIDRHEHFCEIGMDLSERGVRERIAAIPDGVYEAVDWDEFDGHDGSDRLLEIRLRLEVEGSEMRFHFNGAPQTDAFVNATEGPMFGSTMAALMTSLFYGDLPVNGGLWRPITVDLGVPGTIVNAVPPAPVSNAHVEVGMRATKLTKEVLNQALMLSESPVLRGRIAGQNADGFPGASLYGANQHGGTSVMFYLDNAIGCGGGARSVFDGQDAYGLTCTTGGGIPDVETHEAADPVLFLWRQVEPNSGGPGQTRGGLGIGQAFALRYSDGVSGPGFNACAQVPPRGTGGGYPGNGAISYAIRNSNVDELLSRGKLPGRDLVRGEIEKLRGHVSHLELRRDDVFVQLSGGGGGLGDPLLRDPEAVGADVRSGYSDLKFARAVHGVALASDGSPDRVATERLRARMRRQRIGTDPEYELRSPAGGVGVSLVRFEGNWACGSCGTMLGSVDTNWRDEALPRERGLVESHTAIGMRVSPRREPPRVMLREHFCPGCAMALGVEVVVEGLKQLPSRDALERRAEGAAANAR